MTYYSNVKFTGDPDSPWSRAFSYIKPNTKVLDIGCSSGNLGKELIDQKNCLVDGIELNKFDYFKAKKRLRKVHNLNIEVDNLSGIQEKYDYIILSDVIEHLVNPISTLKKIKSLIKFNGEIVFSVPNMAHLSVRLMLLNGDFSYGKTGLLDNSHLHFYTFKEIQRVFNGAGYEILFQEPIIKEYPHRLLETQLKDIGLIPQLKFYKKALESNAVVWQYFGTAKRSNQPKKAIELPMISPGLEFEQQYAASIKEYQNVLKENKLLMQNYQTALKEIRRKEKELYKMRYLPYLLLKKIKNKLRSS